MPICDGGVMSFITDVFAGRAQNESARMEARQIEHESALAREESVEQAGLEREKGRKFSAKQRLAFLKSGVSLAGSPLLAQEEVGRETAAQSQSVLQRGYRDQVKESNRAARVRYGGRNAMLQGVSSSFSKMTGGAGNAAAS